MADETNTKKEETSRTNESTSEQADSQITQKPEEKNSTAQKSGFPLKRRRRYTGLSLPDQRDMQGHIVW